MVNLQRLSELRRSGAEVRILEALRRDSRRAAASHLFQTRHGLQGSDQTRRRHALRIRNHVEAPVHPVHEVHVGVAAIQPHGRVSLRPSAAVAVGGLVLDAEVGLDLDDAARELGAVVEVADEDLAEEGLREGDGVATVEAAAESLSLVGHDRSLAAVRA